MLLGTVGALGIGVALFAARLSAGEPKETAWERTYTQAAQLFEQGRLREAAEMAEELSRIAETAFGPRNIHVADSLLLLGKIADAQQRHARASQSYEQAADILTESGEQAQQAELIEVLVLLARCYRDQGKLDRAGLLYERMLLIKKSQAGGSPLELVDALLLVAEFYLETGQAKRAEALYEQARALQQQVYGNDHPSVAETLVLLAQAAMVQQQIDKASALLERALAIQERTLGVSHAKVGETLVSLAKARALEGRNEEAKTLNERADLIRHGASSAQQPKRPDTYTKPSKFFHSKEEGKDAATLYQQGAEADASDAHAVGAEAGHGSVGGKGPEADGHGAVADDGGVALPAPGDTSPAKEKDQKPKPRVSDAQLKHVVRGAAQREASAASGDVSAEKTAARFGLSGVTVEPTETAERFATMAKSLDARATAYASIGSYDEAETLFKWALEIYDRRLGGLNDAEAKPVVEHYADLLRKTGRTREADALLRGTLPTD